MWAKYKPYILSVAIALAVGGLSAFLIRDNITLYHMINKPAFSPPAFLFPIVWTILYVLVGISSARIWLQRDNHPYEVMDSLLSYALQLILNFFWPIIFFNMQTFLFAFIWLVVLAMPWMFRTRCRSACFQSGAAKRSVCAGIVP